MHLVPNNRFLSSRAKSRDLLFAAAVHTIAMCVLLVTAGAVHAATTTIWELNGYQDFLRGRLSGLSLTRDGRLVPGPSLVPVYSTDQPGIWAVATGPDGSLYLGTGHRGTPPQSGRVRERLGHLDGGST